MYFFAINARWYNGCLNSFGVIVSSEPVFSSVQQYLLGTAQRTELPLSGGYRLQDIRIDPCVLAVDLGLNCTHCTRSAGYAPASWECSLPSVRLGSVRSWRKDTERLCVGLGLLTTWVPRYTPCHY